MLVISDAHTGLIAAVETVFAGASWQRCRVPFVRNVLTAVPKAAGPMVASIVRTTFAQPDVEHVFTQFHEVVRMLSRSRPKVADMLEKAKGDLLAFCQVPLEHWRQIWSTNPLERVNKEIKRRTDVVGMFPFTSAPAAVGSVPDLPRMISSCAPHRMPKPTLPASASCQSTSSAAWRPRS